MEGQAESALYPVMPPNKSIYETEVFEDEENLEGSLKSPATKKEEEEERYINFHCFRVKESTYVLVLFMSINIFLFADQNLLAPNLTVIAQEYGMTDDERDVYLGGYISLGFFAVGGTVSMIVGFLADTLDRKVTFACAVIIGELSCALTYWVPTDEVDDFWYGLWLTRAITGVAIGGAIPIQYSVFGDYFSEKNRGKAVAFLQIAVGVGAGLGQALAGFLSPDWRTPFLLVSIPAFTLVGIYVYTTKDPKRGRVEKALEEIEFDPEIQHKLSWKKFRNLFSRPTFILILVQGLPGILPWGIGQVFLNDFMIVEKNLTSAEAALVVPTQGIGAGFATVAAGFIADYLWKRDMIVAIPLIAGVTTISASFPMMAVIKTSPLDLWAYVLLLPPTGFIAGLGGVMMKTLLINSTLPETRGTAFAFQSLFDDLGRGIGPYFISLLIVSAGSRTDGLFIGYTGWIPAGIIMLFMMFTIRRDVQKNEKELQMTRDTRLSL